jgi:hypothetical protein
MDLKTFASGFVLATGLGYSAVVTGTIQGNNSGSLPVGSISLTNGTLTVTASEAHPTPTLCSPLTTRTFVTCSFRPNFARTFVAGTNSGSFGFSGGAVSREASSVTIQVTSTAVDVQVTCSGTPIGDQCENTSATGSTSATITGQIRIFDTSGNCLWCVDLTGTGTISGTQSLSPPRASYTMPITGNDSPVDTTLGLQFVPIEPCRIADTRLAPGPYGQPVMEGGQTRDFVLTGRCGIPSQVSAVALNVTVVPRGLLGFLTIWPAGQTRPGVSTLNSLDGRVKANAAIVQAGTNKAVSVFVTEQSDVIIDVNGYFVAPQLNSLAYYPINPCRIADTRAATGPGGLPAALGGPALGNVSTRTFPVLTSFCNIPSTARAYSINATVVPAGPLGFITLFPTGSARPVVSTLNAVTGTVVANAAIVRAGTSGSIDVFASETTHVVLDINGYFAPPGQFGALNYFPAPGCRLVDTRNPIGPLGGPAQTALAQREFPLASSNCGIPSGAKAYSLNATVVPPALMGYLTFWPTGGVQPVVSTLNAVDGAITSNAALVLAGAQGSISALTSETTHLILDVNGYFLP